MNDVLALRDNAKSQLQQIKTIETGIEYLNKVRAIEVWVRAEKKDAELQNIIAEQKIRTQRILGQLIQEGQRQGGIATQRENSYIGNQWGMPEGNTPKTLSDIGISRKESSTFQTIANIPEHSFESLIEEKKQKVNEAVAELTTAGILRAAKEIIRQDSCDEIFAEETQYKDDLRPEDFEWYIRTQEPEKIPCIESLLNSLPIPMQTEIDYLRMRSDLYGDEKSVIFIAAFVLIFNRKSFIRELYLRPGIRTIISTELCISPQNTSKLYAIARTRYKLVPSFRRKVDDIVLDIKNRLHEGER
jgi:hypothetical protein